MGLVKVELWYSGGATAVQSARALGSPWMARVARPSLRRFTTASRRGQRDRASGRPSGELPRHQLLEQRLGGLVRAQHLEGAVRPRAQDRQAVAQQHRLDRLAVRVADA